MIVGVTGHRPDKLGGYGDDVFQKLVKTASIYLVKVSADRVLQGMALGWDQACAVAAINLGIPVTAAIPFMGQEKQWPAGSQKKYFEILDKCQTMVQVCEPGYAPWKMQKRNEYMVDRSDRMAALWDGSEGGTFNCVQYARKQDKQIDQLWSVWQQVLRGEL